MSNFASHETFVIEKPTYEFDGDNLSLQVSYKCDEFHFVETFLFEFGPFVHKFDEDELQHAVNFVSLCASPSYYKAMLAKSIECEFSVTKEQVDFLQGLFGPGLAEFRFQNKIDLLFAPTLKGLNKTEYVKKEKLNSSPFVIVPIGGGKDSATTIEIVKKAGMNIIGFSVGDFDAINNTAKVAGVDLVRVTRKLDNVLLELNARGFPNGHVPVTALTSSLAIVAGVVLNASKVIMSNESSADEPTRVRNGYEVNHQWSKTLEAENLIRNSIASANVNIDYFSALRNLSEFEIFSMFASFEKYHEVITSCNKVFKVDIEQRSQNWCGSCDKCRFVFLGLAAFIGVDNAAQVIGANLFEDESQANGFKDLLGIGDNKPFECVGTTRESRMLFRKCMEHKYQRNSVVGKILWPLFSNFSELDEKITKPHHNISELNELEESIEEIQVELYKKRLKESLKGIRVGIVGLGRDTSSILRFLSSQGDVSNFQVFLPVNANASVEELNEILKSNDLLSNSDEISFVKNINELDCDLVFVSPGISKYSDEVVSLGERATTPLAWWLSYNKKYFQDKCFIGVTGTKGKSTTASLLKHVLPNSIVAGNLGFAVGNIPIKELFISDFIVLEVSSFQASYVDVSPDIVAFTSLFDCHIDWHRTPENYRNDKLNLALHGCSEVIVSDTISDFAPLLAKLRSVQSQNSKTDVITLVPSVGRSLLQRNQEVVRAIVSIVCPQMSQEQIDDAFDSFAELKHRQEIISEKSGVFYISDVLSTAPAAVLTAVDDFILRYPTATIFLLLGGADRGVDQSELIHGLNIRTEKIRTICLPETGHYVYQQLADAVKFDELADGVMFAANNAKPGDVVLLAPGAPSFHKWSNYEELASYFEKLVNKLT